MFDLEAFDAEISRQFPERDTGLSVLAPFLDRHKLPIIAASAIFCAGTVFAATATVYTPSPPVPITSDMTYNGMTIEEFAVYMDISIYDPFILVLFEDLCMQE